MRRFHLVATCAFAFVIALYYLTPSSSTRASWSFVGASSKDDTCPNPFNPQPVREPLRDPVCRMLDTHSSLDTAHSLGVELCMSSTIPNHGTIRIERANKDACATSKAITTSSHPESDATLKAKGPDVFHVRLDGEQRLALEVEAEFESSCVYTHYFRLANAAPFNLSIWWVLEDYRAAYELQELATQYDAAKPVLADTHLMVHSPASTEAESCPSVTAVATLPQWRSRVVAEFAETLPLCSPYTPTDGVYLHPHHSEDPAQFCNRYLFQPTGCQWSNPIRFGAPAEDTTRNFQRRNVLVLGDSHVRFAYDLLIDAYKGDWKAYLAAASLKGWNKGETFGETRLDFYWEPVLQENRIEINCTVAQQYDTIVLGAGQHNGILIPREKEHKHQYTLRAWDQLVRNLAKRLGPDACPSQQMPKVVWLGTPARPTRVEPANPSDWLDARSSRRMRLYDEIAWSHFKTIPGAARVDMFALSQPFVNDFGDKLHMRHSDSLAALVQELHEKIRPTEKAYMHLDASREQ